MASPDSAIRQDTIDPSSAASRQNQPQVVDEPGTPPAAVGYDQLKEFNSNQVADWLEALWFF